VADEPLVLYGRQPVREALANEQVEVEQVLLSRRARDVDDIAELAARRSVPLRWVSPEKITRMSGNGRHDQGVVATVAVAAVAELSAGSPPQVPVLVLDGVTNPGNVGMIIRTAAAFGFGVVLPRAGSPDIGPLVVKASAGVALSAALWRCDTAESAVAALREAGFRVLGLSAGAGVPVADRAKSLDDGPVALVLGNETSGVSVAVDEAVAIPMGGGVESLNVAVAAGIACYALGRAGGAWRGADMAD
jgi:23S rRNA (guanosine2251-2'-O)-methyltransferase